MCGGNNYADTEVSEEWGESDRVAWWTPGSHQHQPSTVNPTQLCPILLQHKSVAIKLTILNMVLCAMLARHRLNDNKSW